MRCRQSQIAQLLPAVFFREQNGGIVAGCRIWPGQVREWRSPGSVILSPFTILPLWANQTNVREDGAGELGDHMRRG